MGALDSVYFLIAGVSLHAPLGPESLTELSDLKITEEKSMMLDQVERTVP